MARPPIKLALDPAYDWAALLRFFAARAIPGVDEVEGETYRRTLTTGWMSVTPATRALTVNVAAAGATPIEARLRQLFDIDAPGKRIAAHLRKHEALARSLNKRPGLRVPGVWDPFELGVRAILGQQVSVAAASTLAGRIATKFGKPARGGHATLTRLFPKPEDLADADLSGLGITTRRIATINTFARTLADDPDFLVRDQPLDTFVERIADLPGFGPWTAHYMAMRLGYADAFPASDLGVRKALNMASEKEALRIAEPWRPYRAYATMHLWASLSD